jgi:hypothetical protein
MGFVFYPTGSVEAGIDGYIEIRDPVTGDVTNQIIQVQSKSTESDFKAETAEGFDFYCDARDLDYWLGGNAPVILVLSRPRTKEAYWVSLKDYFEDLARRATRKVHFDKSQDKFDAKCRDALLSLAMSKESGVYLNPLPKRETLYSNLLRVAQFGEHIYLADASFRHATDLLREFDRMEVEVGSEWLLKSQRIMSFHDLSEYPWNRVCDQGTVESFDSSEWAYTDDIDRRRDFVQLINYCLSQKLRPEVCYHRLKGYYYFAATGDLSTKYWSYKRVIGTTRAVFQAYPQKDDPTKIGYYRHSAFSGQFLLFEGTWYLEITPTYHFTWDGFHLSDSYESLLKGIKKLERNPAILGQVIMWAEYLSRDDLFTARYPFLSFDSLATFDIDAGVDDGTWLCRDETGQASARLPENQLALFDDSPG